MNMQRALCFGFLITGLWIAVPAPVDAQANLTDFLRTNPKFLENFRDVVVDASAATVRVRSDGKDVALGLVVEPDGWILTKAFDLKGKLTCRLKDGRELDAHIAGVHQIHDIAVLRIDATGLPCAQLKASKGIAVGAWVASVGTGVNPVAVGVVSVPTRHVVFKGPALSASELSKIGYLGIAMEPAGGGLRIMQVMKDTPAAKAGLVVGDVILKVSGVTVSDPEQFQAEMVKRKPGDQITLHVQRGGGEKDIDATLGPRPSGDNRAELQNHMGSDLSPRRSGYPTILTHDSVVKPADCGGPLVDLDGNVIGINISRAGRTESWAIPTEVIQDLLVDLKSGKLSPISAAATSVGTGSTVTPADRPADTQPDASGRDPRRGVP
jgi:serine protease Do